MHAFLVAISPSVTGCDSDDEILDLYFSILYWWNWIQIYCLKINISTILDIWSYIIDNIINIYHSIDRLDDLFHKSTYLLDPQPVVWVLNHHVQLLCTRLCWKCIYRKYFPILFLHNPFHAMLLCGEYNDFLLHKGLLLNLSNKHMRKSIKNNIFSG